MPTFVLQETTWVLIKYMRHYIEGHTPVRWLLSRSVKLLNEFQVWPAIKKGWLYPDGWSVGRRVWVGIPVCLGLKDARKATETEFALWIDTARGGIRGTLNGNVSSIRIDRFPFDEPRDLKHSFTVIVAEQTDGERFEYPENRLINELVPELPAPWRGNVVVLKHGSTSAKKIINIVETDVALVEAIIKRVIRDGLVGYRKRYMSGLRKRVKRAQTSSASAPSPPQRPHAAAFMAVDDVRHHMLSYVDLVSLTTYASCSQLARTDLTVLARQRVLRYTRPFFDGETALRCFFHSLEDQKAWIVGSVALAALSFTCDFAIPKNLNIIGPYKDEETWPAVMCGALGFSLVSSELCSGQYAMLGKRFLVFVHPKLPGRRVTVTTSADVDFYELFLRATSTLRMNAISAQEIICTYVELTSEFKGVQSFETAFTEPIMPLGPFNDNGQTLPRFNATFPYSPFPHHVMLYGTTYSLGRPCGNACPARRRWSTNIRGIGHWRWGGYDELFCDADEILAAMGDSDITYGTGVLCRNPLCENVSRWK
ncbi:hypothetical protein R3P38DRAFT_3216046 [Favolaschia claudopus]|uniref:Uncharacterized protein n=1 Tax=Favolaschia claudopus TaxID=2862362 RepID=A0AAW0A7B9_9AGAR